jgi:hypothetical protein
MPSIWYFVWQEESTILALDNKEKCGNGVCSSNYWPIVNGGDSHVWCSDLLVARIRARPCDRVTRSKGWPWSDGFSCQVKPTAPKMQGDAVFAFEMNLVDRHPSGICHPKLRRDSLRWVQNGTRLNAKRRLKKKEEAN